MTVSQANQATASVDMLDKYGAARQDEKTKTSEEVHVAIIV